MDLAAGLLLRSDHFMFYASQLNKSSVKNGEQTARLGYMDSGFIVITIRRIARRKLFSSLFFLAAIFMSVSCFLGLLWLIKLADTMFYLSIIAAGLIIGGLLTRNVVILFRTIHNPLESFFLSDLKRHGPLQQTIDQIDRESSSYLGKTGSFVTRHWIISVQPNSLRFMHIEDVVWIYKQIVENKIRFYYVLTVSTGKTYAAQICNRSGICMRILSTENGVDGLLEAIDKNAPWVTKGYMEIIAEAWRSNRAVFVSTVDKRRQQILGSAEEVNTGSDGYKPIENGGFLKSGVEPLQNSVIQPPQYDLNHSVIRAGIETYEKKRDRNIRAMGCVALFFGLVLSAAFILPLVYGVLENLKEISISSEGILLSMVVLVLGVYYSAFGWKGKGFLENTVGKSRWGCVLFAVVICIGAIFFNYVLESLLRLFGYEVVNPYLTQ